MKRSNAPLFSLAFVVLAIVGIFSFALPYYREYTDLTNKDQSLKALVLVKQAALENLKDIAAKANRELVAKYLTRFREDKVIDLLFGAQRVDFSIGDFSLNDGGKTANGLSVGNVTLTPTFKSIEALRAYLDHLSRNDVVISSLTVTQEQDGRDTVIRAPLTVAIYYAQ